VYTPFLPTTTSSILRDSLAKITAWLVAFFSFAATVIEVIGQTISKRLLRREEMGNQLDPQSKKSAMTAIYWPDD
jgi:hypothetical protein